MNYNYSELINMDIEDLEDIKKRKAQELAEEFKKRDEKKFREIGQILFYQEQIKIHRGDSIE